MTNDNGIYYCKICGMRFKQNNWAQKCEDWCKEHNSCNIDIVRHAI